MSDDRSSRRLPKWPFYFADIALSAIAVFVLYQLGTIEGAWKTSIAAACLLAAGWAAWFSITPWLTEYRAQSSLADSSNLKSSLEQIRQIESLATFIKNANSQWQGVQDASNRTVTAAQEIADRMKAETADFMNFIEKAHDQERANLRLEVEKLRRMEGDWIKSTVQIMDHIYALHRAAVRSRQDSLITQLNQFQSACREVARRVGLVPYVPAASEAFNAQAHQLPDPKFTPPENARIGEVLATGFTYQGQLLRRALVLLEQPVSETPQSQQETVEVAEDDFSEVEPQASTEGQNEESEATQSDGEEPEDRSPQGQLPLV